MAQPEGKGNRRSRIEVRREQERSIHERGGLGIDHWTKIARDGRQARHPISMRVLEYADAVIDGRIIDENFAHRKYLSRKDWQTVASQYDQVTPEKPPLIDRVTGRPVDMPPTTDVALYALLEAHRTPYTIDDYIEQLTNVIPFPSSREPLGDNEWIEHTPRGYWNGTEWITEITSTEKKHGSIHHPPADDYYFAGYTESITIDGQSTQVTRLVNDEELATIKKKFLVGDDITVSSTTPLEFFHEHLRNLARQQSPDIENLLYRYNISYDNSIGLLTLPTSRYNEATAQAIAQDLQLAYSQHIEGVQPFVSYDKGSRLHGPRASFTLSPSSQTSEDSVLKGNIDREEDVPQKDIFSLREAIPQR